MPPSTYCKPTHVGTEGLPWHPFTPYSDQVHLKLLHIDPVRGEVVALLKSPSTPSSPNPART